MSVFIDELYLRSLVKGKLAGEFFVIRVHHGNWHYIFQFFKCSQTSIPVPSSVNGVVEELLVADGDTVTAGTDLCRIRITGRTNFQFGSVTVRLDSHSSIHRALVYINIVKNCYSGVAAVLIYLA